MLQQQGAEQIAQLEEAAKAHEADREQVISLV